VIFRRSQKLHTKIKGGTLPALLLDSNPFADWSARLFVANRTQYILLSNTKSLYSAVMPGKGITNESEFLGRAVSNLREFMQNDGQEFVYRRFIAPACATVHFARALDRTVTSSLNELVVEAKAMLAEDDLRPTMLPSGSMICCCLRLHQANLKSIENHERRSRHWRAASSDSGLH
jgi:hypothetical protein